MKHLSFINERTTELTLVSVLRNILKKHYSHVTPINPWLTREGNNFSRSIHENSLFKVFGLFARRPKFDLINNKFIIKINQEILEQALLAQKYHIPFIAGCPYVRDIFELDESAFCMWIKINNLTKEYYEFEEKDIFSGVTESAGINNIIEEGELIEYIDSNSKFFNFNEFFNSLTSIKYDASPLIRHSYFGTIYKPVYFLLKV